MVWLRRSLAASLLLLWTIIASNVTLAFLLSSRRRVNSPALLKAKPQRLPDNVDGVVYINDKVSVCKNVLIIDSFII